MNIIIWMLLFSSVVQLGLVIWLIYANYKPKQKQPPFDESLMGVSRGEYGANRPDLENLSPYDNEYNAELELLAAEEQESEN